jgi:hypothetical protein
MVRINIKPLVAIPRIKEICTLTKLQSEAIKHTSLKNATENSVSIHENPSHSRLKHVQNN